jgi:hypothetical protein
MATASVPTSPDQAFKHGPPEVQLSPTCTAVSRLRAVVRAVWFGAKLYCITPTGNQTNLLVFAAGLEMTRLGPIYEERSDRLCSPPWSAIIA